MPPSASRTTPGTTDVATAPGSTIAVGNVLQRLVDDKASLPVVPDDLVSVLTWDALSDTARLSTGSVTTHQTSVEGDDGAYIIRPYLSAVEWEDDGKRVKHHYLDHALGIESTLKYCCSSKMEVARGTVEGLTQKDLEDRDKLIQMPHRLELSGREYTWILQRAMADKRNAHILQMSQDMTQVHALEYCLSLTLGGDEGASFVFKARTGTSAGRDPRPEGVLRLAGSTLAPGQSAEGVKNVGPTEITIKLCIFKLQERETEEGCDVDPNLPPSR